VPESRIHPKSAAAVTWPGTPFAPRTASINGNALWMLWDRMMVVDVYADAREELRAIREAVAMGDMSPLSKYEVRGPGAERFLDHLIPRDVTKLAVGQVYYTPWCDEHGRLVNDGLVIRTGETSFRLSADPNEGWLRRHAEGFDVELDDVTTQIAILTLQGPQAPAVLEAASGEDWSRLPFSRLGHAEVAGVAIDLLRQGFTGEIGYELWVEADAAPLLWDAIAEAGAPHGILPAGALALDVARAEAGLLIIGYDYTSAGGDRPGATVEADHAHEGTPYELGLGRLVDLDKGDFIGKPALSDEATRSNGERLAGLECDWRALQAAYEQLGEPSPDLGRVQWYPKPLLHDGRVVGRASSIVWAPSAGRLIGFAHVPAELTAAGTELSVRWAVGGQEVEVPATIRELPFLELRRAG
jgi:aminomethyltransferase